MRGRANSGTYGPKQLNRSRHNTASDKSSDAYQWSDFELARRISFILDTAQRSPRPPRRRKRATAIAQTGAPQASDTAMLAELEEKLRAAEAQVRAMEERALAAEATIARMKQNEATIAASAPAPAPVAGASEADLRRQLTALLVRAKAAEMQARDMESRALAAEELIARGR